MKILNVNKFHHVRGGADRYYFDLAKILEQHGCAVVPFSTNHPRNKETVYHHSFVQGFTEDDFHKLSFWQKVMAFVNGVYSHDARIHLRRLIFEEAPDVAHLHGLFYQLSLSVIDELADRNIPIVYSLHDYQTVCMGAFLYYNGEACSACRRKRDLNGLMRKCYRGKFLPSLMAYGSKKVNQIFRILDRVDVFTVPHEMMREELVSWGFPREKFRMVWNPFFYDDIPAYPYQADSRYFVFLGRLVRSKGIFTVLEAFKDFRDKDLWIFGSGPDEEAVRDYIAQNKMQHVRLNTHLRWGDKLKETIGNSLGVISASEWPTPSEYVIYEAMALGMPVIASDNMGNAALIKNEKNGLLFYQGNAQNLVSCLRKCLSMDGGQMGRLGRQFVEENLSSEIFWKKMSFIYEDLLEQKRMRGAR